MNLIIIIPNIPYFLENKNLKLTKCCFMLFSIDMFSTKMQVSPVPHQSSQQKEYIIYIHYHYTQKINFISIKMNNMKEFL